MNNMLGPSLMLLTHAWARQGEQWREEVDGAVAGLSRQVRDLSLNRMLVPPSRTTHPSPLTTHHSPLTTYELN